MENRLIDIEDFCAIMHCGKTKGRELLRKEPYGIHIGGRWYADRKKLEAWIDRNGNDKRKVG